MDLFVSKLQGVSIPTARIDQLQWLVSAVSSIKVDIEEDADGISQFWLQQQVEVNFARMLFKIGEKDPMVVEQGSVPYYLERELLLASALFTTLSEKSAEKLQSVLNDINKYRTRIRSGEKQLAELHKLISVDDEENGSVKDIKKQLRIRKRKLNEAMDELQAFESKKSATLVEGEQTCENLTIMQARATKFWQENNVEVFYSNMINEEFAGNMTVFENMQEQDLESEELPIGVTRVNPYDTNDGFTSMEEEWEKAPVVPDFEPMQAMQAMQVTEEHSPNS